jgi:hypothetical protein
MASAPPGAEGTVGERRRHAIHVVAAKRYLGRGPRSRGGRSPAAGAKDESHPFGHDPAKNHASAQVSRSASSM